MGVDIALDRIEELEADLEKMESHLNTVCDDREEIRRQRDEAVTRCAALTEALEKINGIDVHGGGPAVAMVNIARAALAAAEGKP